MYRLCTTVELSASQPGNQGDGNFRPIGYEWKIIERLASAPPGLPFFYNLLTDRDFYNISML